MAANKREIIGAIEVERMSDDKLFLKSLMKDTPFTNKFDTMPRVHPTLSPIRSNEKRSINRFLILVVIDLPYKIFCKSILIELFIKCTKNTFQSWRSPAISS